MSKPVLVTEPKSDPTIKKMLHHTTSDSSEFYIKLELDDIKAILEADGVTASLSSIAIGENAHKESLQPLLQHYKDCKTVKGILISFTTHKDFTIIELLETAIDLSEVFTQEEDILFSVLIDNRLSVDEVHTDFIIKY